MSDSIENSNHNPFLNTQDLKSCVEKFLEENYVYEDGVKPIFYCPKNSKFYEWREGKYEKIEDIEIKNKIMCFLDKHYQKKILQDHSEEVTKVPNRISTRNEFLDRFKNTHIQGIKTDFIPDIQSKWLYVDDEKWPDPSLMIPTENCIVNISEFIAQKFSGRSKFEIASNSLQRITPRFCNTWQLPCKMNANDYGRLKPTGFINFLETTFHEDNNDPDNRDCIRLTLEWIGYMLTENTHIHKILFLIGASGSGKGTLIRCMQQILGAKNYVTPNISHFTSQYGFSSWVGKKAAFFTDAKFSEMQRPLAESHLLAVSGADEVEISTKYEPTYQAKLPTKIVLAANSMPRFEGAAAEFERRALLIQFDKSIPSEKLVLGIENTFLPKELPLIIWTCLDAYCDLANRKWKFIQPKSGEKSLKVFNQEQNTCLSFVHDKCNFGKDLYIGKENLYRHYEEWCREKNYELIKYNPFCRQMNTAFGNRVWSDRKGSGGSEYVFCGIDIKNPFRREE